MTQLSEVEFLSAKTVQSFKRNNINTVVDLLYSFPSRFEDYTIVSIDEITDVDKVVSIAGIVQGKASSLNVKNNLNIMRFIVDVDGVDVKATIFNRQFLKSKISYGTYVRLTGKFDETKTKFTASEVAFNEFESAIQPVFNIKGVDDKKVLQYKERLFYEYRHELIEDLPQDIRKEFDLVSIDDAIKYINIPDEMSEAMKAIRRIKFEELLKYQIKIKYLFYMRKHHPEGVAINFDRNKVNAFIESLPYTLTVDQVKSLQEILTDMSSKYKMNRLLQGEVGSGKTVVSAISLYAATTASYQGAIMVPTEVLASQHYITFKKLFENTNLKIALLTSSVSSKERKEILDGLNDGTIDIVIGTHSLIQKDVTFKKLGLVVTDEEHRFGVKQRVSMVGKGYLIDHLKMSATPIPRTLAISLLGESDISIIKTLPGNRKEVITRYINYDDRQEVFDHVKEQIKEGRQVYIITPTIEESDAMDLQNALNVYERTKKYYEGFCNVGLIHGKLKQEEKEEVMRKFYQNEIQILVATSVIEVGVNVENATTIIILDADRFGIAQLHQMRGRVRRSDYQAYCFMISKTTVDSSIKRLKLVEETNDGFALAEEDLLIRGAGDLFGEKQSGGVSFKMADIVVDNDLLELANKCADKMFMNKKIFEDPEYKNLFDMAQENYEEKKEMLE
ncbi:MAG: ATP-dependent DNA helicase RecG [Acholeplasmataceae bacterium]|nr:ATP-dependent DNA helicase RecG [Acholeplasmataceae bacterium]